MKPLGGIFFDGASIRPYDDYVFVTVNIAFSLIGCPEGRRPELWLTENSWNPPGGGVKTIFAVWTWHHPPIGRKK
jgi:hypothetical protein